MRYATAVTATMLVLGMAQPAQAGDVILQPVPVGLETMRFDHGVATLDLQGRGAAVQVTPRGMRHGSWVFDVAVINTGTLPVNFSRDNIAVASDAGQVAVLTPQQLVSKAKHRAFWRTMAVAAIGGVAAGVAASQTSTYRARTTYYGSNARGGSRTLVTGPSVAGQIQAAQFSQGGTLGAVAIQAQLDRTRAEIGERAIELTTVDPGMSYGGQIVLAKMTGDAPAQRVGITVSWNGELFPFSFRFAARGTPPLPFPTTQPLALPRPIPAVVPVTAPAFVAPTRIAAVPFVPVMAQPVAAVALAAPVPVGTGGITQAERYQRRLAAARGVRGSEPQQGWTISD